MSRWDGLKLHKLHVWWKQTELAFSFYCAARDLRREGPRQAGGNRRRSMGHSSSSETVAQQPEQRNTGELDTRLWRLVGSQE